MNKANSYSTFDMGRMLSVALRVDSPAYGQVMEQVAREHRATARAKIKEMFRSADEHGDLSAVLLGIDRIQQLAYQELQTAFEHAYHHMDMFPKCPFIVEIAAGRDCQRN
jgi:hypothetical protein